jgi:hypothetical protein
MDRLEVFVVNVAKIRDAKPLQRVNTPQEGQGIEIAHLDRLFVICE